MKFLCGCYIIPENIKDKNEILKLNNDRYLELAKKISQIRNERSNPAWAWSGRNERRQQN